MNKASKKIRKMNDENTKIQKDTQDTNNQILALKVKHETEK